jgi:hypothetical protein
MGEDSTQESLIKRLIQLDLPEIKYESFLGLGFESVVIGVTAGLIFGAMVGSYPLIASFFPFFPASNLILFIAIGVPLTGSTHYDPKLGVLSSTVLFVSARATQLGFGLAPYTLEFLLLAGIWSIAQVFFIGYLPGKLIPTSENLKYLFKGMLKVSLLYGAAEYMVWIAGKDLLLHSSALLTFPLISIPLIILVSTTTTFFFTNTFCPYMMMPLISSAVKGRRHCGAGNFVFKLGAPVKINNAKIKKAGRKGFKVVSRLPSVTVFSCPRGGIISVYHSGDMLVRKVNQGTAERINNHLKPIIIE